MPSVLYGILYIIHYITSLFFRTLHLVVLYMDSHFEQPILYLVCCGFIVQMSYSAVITAEQFLFYGSV